MPVNPPLDLAALRSAVADARSPWRVVDTSMTAMTEEQRVIRLGVSDVPDDPSAIQALSSAAAATSGIGGAGAATAFDLRNVGGVDYATPVEDQGNCGSCVAFAVVGAMEHVTRYTRGTPNLPTDLSEAQLFYCYGASVGANCETGWLPEGALDACQNGGITYADYYPYTAGDQNCTGLNPDWPNHMVKAVSWQSLTNNPAGMKQYIADYGSVTACFFVYQDFFSYGGGIYQHVTGSLAGGHCVTLVGYDDSAGCWIGKNSWSTSWGEAGFFRIAYGQCGIESWHVCGVPATTLRTWLPNQQILSLWSNDSDDNMWAYGSLRGWVKLDGSATATSQVMAMGLAADKPAGRDVGMFEDSGVIKQIYAW